jgi:hypothetical protein
MNKAELSNSLDKDYPPMGPITNETVECTARLSSRFRGNVRMAMGKIITDEEYERRREKAMNLRLP